jgi:hypothetical protein
MNYRIAELLSAEDQTAGAGTRTIEIGGSDIISRIDLEWRITKAKVGMDSYPHKDITKIELVDGSDVLHSLDGGQNQGLCIFDRKAPTMNEGAFINANYQFSRYGIDFGRFLFDPVLALDPSKFRNLQLKVTYDEDVSDTSATANALAVWAHCFDEKSVMPIGFLSAKNIESWSLSAAGAYHYLDLPTDQIIRKMLIQGYRKAYEPWYQVIEAKLSEDTDKRIPFNWNLETYFRSRMEIDTPVSERIAIGHSGSACVFYFTPTDYWATLITQGQGAGDQAGTGASGKGGAITIATGGSTQSQGIVSGWLPNHCFQFPFGDQMDMDDWYDVTMLKNLKLRLLSGAGTSGNVDTILQQLRRY